MVDAAAAPQSAVLARLASSVWAYPLLEMAHIVGIALLVGALVLFELRMWGFGMALPVAALARLALGVSWLGFALAAASGLTMFATHAGDLLVNPAFRLKMALLAAAGLNAALFHARAGTARLDRTARWQGVVSIALWLGVVACGRSIAYV